MAAKKPRDLPTVEELDLAEYKLGSARSDLDRFVTAMESQTITVEAGIALLDQGAQIPKGEPLDPSGLARIIVFATDVLDDAQVIEEYARKLLNETRALYHEQSGPEGLQRHRAAVRAWHEQEAARGEEQVA